MEILAGARSPAEASELRDRLLSFPVLRLDALQGFEAAAALYRGCRSAGETPRSLADCLIAIPVIEAGAELLHADADFDLIARHTELRIHPASGASPARG